MGKSCQVTNKVAQGETVIKIYCLEIREKNKMAVSKESGNINIKLKPLLNIISWALLKLNLADTFQWTYWKYFQYMVFQNVFIIMQSITLNNFLNERK